MTVRQQVPPTAGRVAHGNRKAALPHRWWNRNRLCMRRCGSCQTCARSRWITDSGAWWPRCAPRSQTRRRTSASSRRGPLRCYPCATATATSCGPRRPVTRRSWRLLPPWSLLQKLMRLGVAGSSSADLTDLVIARAGHACCLSKAYDTRYSLVRMPAVFAAL